MTMTKIYDIAYEIDGNNINLEQGIGCGEVTSICLHRIHLQHIAGQLGIPTLDASAATIKRRFQTVADRLEALASTQHYREDILDRCSIGLEFITELDAICDLAGEFLEDLDDPLNTDRMNQPDETKGNTEVRHG